MGVIIPAHARGKLLAVPASEGMTCAQCGTALDSRSTFCPTCGATVPDRHLDGAIAGRYVAERRIAIGGFGSIYRGYEIASGRAVALKIMHRELASDGSLVGRFRREGLVLLKLVERHAVATYELGETDDGVPFIAMELLEGDTLLATFRAAGTLPWRRALGIARGVCSALAGAHALGIVHRDLKPANIFLTANDFAKVLDFGIAKILSNSEVSDPRELTIMGTAVGTLEYMAPEQLMGGKADPRTDFYALGVVMYETITGRRPFNAAGLELLTEQLGGPPPPPSTFAAVPSDVDALVLRCLSADIDDRFASAADLALAIDAALAAHPNVAPPLDRPVQPRPIVIADEPPVVPPARPKRREPSIRWGRLVTVVVIIVGAAVAAFVARYR